MPRMLFSFRLSLFLILTLLVILAVCSQDEQRLLISLFRGYQPLVRPVPHANSTAVVIYMGLQLVLLINVDEKNQIMHTNVWLTLVWHDFQMQWNPSDYLGIDTLRVPMDKVWLPDIVMFNNADGNYEVSFHSNVVVSHTGQMLWVPPAIYKSSCIIDVEHFPFDEQECTLNFGSWTFNADEVKLDFNKNVGAVDLTQFYYSTIWDVIECPAQLNSKRNRIEYIVILRRKSLFYTVVLILPTVLMAFLSMMTFYLPAQAGEKITLAISILLSLVVFLLLVSKILPATSSTIPLMAKYLLLTFVLNVITILVTVIIINVYYRSPTTHLMPRWVKSIFIGCFARLLMMKRPRRLAPRCRTVSRSEVEGGETHHRIAPPPPQPPPRPLDVATVPGYGLPGSNADHYVPATVPHHANCPFALYSAEDKPDSNQHQLRRQDRPRPRPQMQRVESAVEADQDLLRHAQLLPGLSPASIRAINAIDYITEHLKQDVVFKKARDDWKYVAMVIDRLLLYVFFGVTLGGTVGIICSAPNIFESIDQRRVVDLLMNKYKAE